MDRLAKAGRQIADIRIGADRLLEALFVDASEPHQQSTKPSLQLILKEEAAMRQHFQDLRTIGKGLQDYGVLGESLRARSNSWKDGAGVAYAWKRQLAGQAGASAVDRTRLALKAFIHQKRSFFPHLDDGAAPEPAKKKHCAPHERRTLSDVLMLLEKEVPSVKISTHQRLESRQASLVSNANKDKVSVLELFFPSIVRVIISLHPAGSTDADSVAFFSPDESGSYVHARGFSTHHVFRKITEHASLALQYFVDNDVETSLYTFLHWVCSYQTIFTKVCSKCGRLMLMDKQSRLFLPPVCRPYRNFSATKASSKNSAAENQTIDNNHAFHIGCFLEA